MFFFLYRNPQEFPLRCEYHISSCLNFTLFCHARLPDSVFLIHLFVLQLSVDFREEDVSDDNRSPSLGRSAPSDDASVASDYQDDVVPECEFWFCLTPYDCVSQWDICAMQTSKLKRAFFFFCHFFSC